MELYLKITAGLLLLVQPLHLASVQYTTNSPGQTTDISWLRELAKKTAGSQNAAGEETENHQNANTTAIESSNDYSSGIASGFMAVYSGEDENVASQEKDANEGSDDLVVVTTTAPLTITTKQAEIPDGKVSPTTASMDPVNPRPVNMTDTQEELNDSTTSTEDSKTDLSSQDSTSISDSSNNTDSQTTTLAPKGSATQQSTTKPDKNTLTTGTEFSNTATTTTTTTTTTTIATTTISTATTTTTAAATTPEINVTRTTSSSTTHFQSEITEMSPENTTTADPNAPEMANKTGKDSATGNGSDRGLESDSQRSKRNGAWGAVLGTAVAVGFVGLVAYVILKKKHQKAFSHRKLVEEYPSDPVQRLDNGEPLDLNYGGSAYYNPGLQGDHIQMTNLPGRH